MIGKGARSRRLVWPTGALLALLLAGCSTTTAGAGGSVTVTGHTLTIYAAAPSSALDSQGQADILGAEQLAFAQGRQAAQQSYHLNFTPLTAPKLSDNARAAIKDSTAIAYLGENAPGGSAASIGITNALDLLQVSPTDTAVELTQSSLAIPGSPGRYYEAMAAYGRTFARVVPTTVQEASALLTAMGSAKSVYVATDSGEYGAALAAAFRSAASGHLSLASSPSGAGTVLLAMSDPARAEAFAAQHTTAKLFAPSALDAQTVAQKIPGLEVTTPGFLKPDPAFADAFQARFHHAPDPRAVFGYEAMSDVLASIKAAGAAANNRTNVIHAFFANKPSSSPLGSFSIDASGDVKGIAPFVLAHVRGGRFVAFRTLSS